MLREKRLDGARENIRQERLHRFQTFETFSQFVNLS